MRTLVEMSLFVSPAMIASQNSGPHFSHQPDLRTTAAWSSCGRRSTVVSVQRFADGPSLQSQLKAM